MVRIAPPQRYETERGCVVESRRHLATNGVPVEHVSLSTAKENPLMSAEAVCTTEFEPILDPSWGEVRKRAARCVSEADVRDSEPGAQLRESREPGELEKLTAEVRELIGYAEHNAARLAVLRERLLGEAEGRAQQTTQPDPRQLPDIARLSVAVSTLRELMAATDNHIGRLERL